LNVAISRAQTLAIVVGSPTLVRTRCSSIEQIRLVNVYCRAVAEGGAGASAAAGFTLMNVSAIPHAAPRPLTTPYIQ